MRITVKRSAAANSRAASPPPATSSITSSPPAASVNFIAAHDGRTLTDVVTYRERHNLANGEHNRDGHSHEISANFGIEGPSDHLL